jgi:hypothetical protein
MTDLYSKSTHLLHRIIASATVALLIALWGVSSSAMSPVSLPIGANAVNGCCPSGLPNAYYKGFDGNLWREYWTGSAWAWQNLGAPSGASIAASLGVIATNGATYPAAFIVDSNGTLWRDYWTGSTWIWESHPLPNGLKVTIPLGSTPDNNAWSYVFVVASDGNIYWLSWSGAWAWHNLGTPGVKVAAAAGVMSLVNTTSADVFFIGSDGNLWRLYWANGGAWAWASLGNPGVKLSPMGSTFVNNNTWPYIFFLGSDGNIWLSGWSGSYFWQNLGHPGPAAIRASIGAVAISSDSAANLFVTGSDANVWRLYWNSAAWLWENLGAPSGSAIAGGVGVTANNNDAWPYVFLYTTDRNLWSVNFNGSSWSWARQTNFQATLGNLVVFPKYIIVGVTYAPPGPASYVKYSQTATVGTTITSSQSFAAGTSFSVSSQFAGDLFGWTDEQETATTTTSATQTTTNTQETDIEISSTSSNQTNGPPDPYAPVNHDYDEIWLWLNPVAQYVVQTSPVNAVTFEKLGFDLSDQPAMDIVPFFVGELNGHIPLIYSKQQQLARAWAAAGKVFPAGDGPAITQADIANILAADPFTNSAYSFVLNTGVNPYTTMDGRFTISSPVNGSATSINYLPGNNQTRSLSTSDSSTTGQSTKNEVSQTFAFGSTGSVSIEAVTFKNDLKLSNTLTWTNTQGTSVKQTTTYVNALSLTGPCSAAPCNPPYNGPTDFDVYQDNVFGAFYFNPVR